MGFSLSDHAGNRDNHFTLIRFIAASLVLVSHCYPLTGTVGEPLERFGLTLGYVAVDVFFVTSGFLVCSSLMRRTPLSFLLARARRILPGLAVAVGFCVFVVGPLFTRLDMTEYFTQPATWDFWLRNTLIVPASLRWELPGVFMDNPFRGSVNGSLWTLPWEVRMYTILFLLGLIRYARRIPRATDCFAGLVLALTLVSMALYFRDFVHGVAWNNRWRFIFLFFMGASFWIYRHRVRMSWWIFVIPFFLLPVCAMMDNRLLFVAYTLSLGYMILFAAYIPSSMIRRFNPVGDYSYGIYIYAFPIQQAVSAIWPGIGIGAMLIFSFPLCLSLAILSWHCVEKPLLRPTAWRRFHTNSSRRYNVPRTGDAPLSP